MKKIIRIVQYIITFSALKKQIEGVIDGVKYVVGFTRGRIGQFYIKE